MGSEMCIRDRVRGSVAERELQEVGLKLAVLADQLELQTSARNRSIV